jgi:GNAT superfamily N-acetyltransferase
MRGAFYRWSVMVSPVSRQRPEHPEGPVPAGALEIRPGRAEDATAIAQLIVRENTRPADAAEIGQYLARAPSVVAVLNDEIVGAIYSRQFSPDILEWRNGLVAAAVRRRGIGRMLVERMEQESRRAGYRALIGVNCWRHAGATQERASAARAFWRAMGWTIVFATDGSAVLARHL